MQITNEKVVAIHYTLTNNDGTVLDSSEGREPLYYLHGFGNLIAGMEEGVEGKRDTRYVQFITEMIDDNYKWPKNVKIINWNFWFLYQNYFLEKEVIE